jgi:hypothetical protein
MHLLSHMYVHESMHIYMNLHVFSQHQSCGKLAANVCFVSVAAPLPQCNCVFAATLLHICRVFAAQEYVDPTNSVITTKNAHKEPPTLTLIDRGVCIVYVHNNKT